MKKYLLVPTLFHYAERFLYPNAFSILCIPDNEKALLISPYTYKNGWKHYELESKQEIEEQDSEFYIERASRIKVVSGSGLAGTIDIDEEGF